MYIHRQPIFHDRQFSAIMGDQTVTVAEGFKNIAGATLTTKDLGENGNYTGFTSILLSASNNNTLATFRLLIDGIPTGPTFDISLRVKDLDIGYTLMTIIDDLPPNTELQLQYSTNIGTVTLVEFTILIDGIPQGRVVE